jgi:hypothetical protein
MELENYFVADRPAPPIGPEIVPNEVSPSPRLCLFPDSLAEGLYRSFSSFQGRTASRPKGRPKGGRRGFAQISNPGNPRSMCKVCGAVIW